MTHEIRVISIMFSLSIIYGHKLFLDASNCLTLNKL